MACRSLHEMDSSWSSSAIGLTVSVDMDQFSDMGMASNRFSAPSGAPGAFAEWIPPTPLDLTDYDELRFWIRADTRADGSAASPFYLELSYTDTGDAVGEEHRWFVPINQQGQWEQRRIGLESERRSAVDRVRFSTLSARPFSCNVDNLLAVREEMLADLESELSRRLPLGLVLAGVSDLPLAIGAASGATEVVVSLNRTFDVGNQVLLSGGAGDDEHHVVSAMIHDTGTSRTTLQFAADDPIVGSFGAGTGRVTVELPVIAEVPPVPTPERFPAIILTMLEAREDAERTPLTTQRDSFRNRGPLTVCSTRTPAQAYVVDYQITVVARRRAQLLFVQNAVLERLCMLRCATSIDVLRVNGYPLPLAIRSAPDLIYRQQETVGLPAPMYVRIGTRMETAPRSETPWALSGTLGAGPLDAPLDEEVLTLNL